MNVPDVPAQRFAGGIPEAYDRFLVPLLFDRYAADLAARIASTSPGAVLEVAAGTGALTRQLAAVLPDEAAITATDLSAAMLERAAARGAVRPVDWRTADITDLPFPDATFDAVVCQFGLMFVPDRSRAFAESRRVLRPGGSWIFSVWDDLGHNDFASAIVEALRVMFPDDPPVGAALVAHGWRDSWPIADELVSAGFDASSVRVEGVELETTARSSWDPAIGLCHGTPMRDEIEERLPGGLDDATAAAAAAIARQHGEEDLVGRSRAVVVGASVGAAPPLEERGGGQDR